MKARDAVAVGALRSALAAIDNAEAVATPAVAEFSLAVESSPVGVGAAEVARRQLSYDDIAGIVRHEVADRESAAEAYDLSGRSAAAGRLHAEARLLQSFLPQDVPPRG